MVAFGGFLVCKSCNKYMCDPNLSSCCLSCSGQKKRQHDEKCQKIIPNPHLVLAYAKPLCLHCKQVGRNPGFDFCSGECGRNFQAFRLVEKLCIQCKKYPKAENSAYCYRPCVTISWIS